MKKLIIKGPNQAVPQKNARSSLYNTALAITYGTIDSNNDNSTTNVKLVNGFLATKIRIPSSYYPTTDTVQGGIEYPPVGAEVVIIHPIGDLNSGFILPAGLEIGNSDVENALFGQGNIKILPGGWTTTNDPDKGKYTFSNGDTFVLDVDPDSQTFSLTDFQGNTFKNNGTVLEINGNSDFAVGYTALNTALQTFITDLNAKLVTALSAAGSSWPGTSLDISGSKVDSVKLK